MRFYAVYVIHQHPAVFSDSFPYIGCFAASRFYIVPRIVVDISAVNRIRDRLAYAGAAFLCHIEEMILSVHLGNVSVDIRKIFGIVKEWFRFTCQMSKIIIGISIVKFVSSVSETHGKVYHQFTFGFVINRFGSPCATYFLISRKSSVETDVRSGPVYQIGRAHENQCAVIAPAVFFSVAFPLGFTITGFPGIDVKVGHGQIECTVGSAHDVGIAYASL